MSPRGLREEDEKLGLKPTPWTQEETDALHEMVREYIWSRRLRKKAAWYIGWFVGLPAAVLTFWEQIERVLKLLHIVK